MKNMFKGGKMPQMPADMPMPTDGSAPDLSALMGGQGMPDMSSMPDLSALMGGGAGRPKMPKGMSAFNGLFRKRR